MNGSESRTHLLQQIPVLALRELIGAHLDDPVTRSAIQTHFYSVLHCRPRNFHRAMQRLTREQLTALIVASPEIGDDEIAQQFEEHRYGISPSFFIYIFDPALLDTAVLNSFRDRFVEMLKEFNTLHEVGRPNVRRVALNDLGPLHDRPEVIEATYRFQSRLGYIDEEENIVSPYETLYGFFWINTVDGYVIIQARHPDVLKAVREAIEHTAGIQLTALVITKSFKNSLAFLQTEQMCSARLHDPTPDSPSFRWLSISDDKLYTKNYQMWEGIYPEVRSARYRTVLEDVKETTLTIRCDRGSLSLAGAIPASLFRGWCLNSLGEVIRVHHKFQVNAVTLVPTLDLSSKAEMARFTGIQKERITDLIIALLTVKSGSGADTWVVKTTPLELASTLGKYVTVQVPFQCQEAGCDPDEELLVACENCGKNIFLLQRVEDGWELVCCEHRTKRWAGRLPLILNCRNAHHIELDEEALADGIIILPGTTLLQAIADVINRYLKGYNFDLAQETFIVRGRNLWYTPDRGKAWSRIMVIQNIKEMKGGVLKGVEVNITPPG